MEIAKDIVTMVGTLGALVIGFLGLKIWRIQQRSTTDHDLARRLLVGLYKIKMHVGMIRNPMRPPVSIPDEKRFDQRAIEEAYGEAYQKQWKELHDVRVDLQVACVEAQALWDRNFFDNFIPLNVCLRELEMHLQDYIQSRLNPHQEPLFDREKTSSIIWKGWKEPDEWLEKLDGTIADIDKKIRVKFEREAFWHSLI